MLYQAACPEGSEGSTVEAKEGEEAAVAAPVTSATGMECCEGGEGSQGAEPMAVEEEKDGQLPAKPEEAAGRYTSNRESCIATGPRAGKHVIAWDYPSLTDTTWCYVQDPPSQSLMARRGSRRGTRT